MSGHTIARYILWALAAGFVAFRVAMVGVMASFAPSIFAEPTAATPLPLAVTVVPQETNTYFDVENAQILYRYFPTQGTPCRYFLSGRVHDLNGIPYLDFVVNVKRVDIETTTSAELIQDFPGTDYTESDPSGWLILLSQPEATYDMWLTAGSGGQELSPHIVVPMRDCNENRAIVNFAQVRPIPNQTPSSSPITATVTPLEADAPFVVENNQITYTYSQNLGRPCYYEMAGRVLDLEGNPFTAFVVNIKILDELAPERPGYAVPGEGYVEDGPSGWATMLPSSPVYYEIWLTTEVGGTEISPHILVPPQDCVHNLARINFIQVKPLSL